MLDLPSLAPLLTVAASDLDDTLLRHDGTVSPRTEAAIAAWLEAGRHFVVATGRPPRSVGERLPPLLHSVPWICYNGAEIRHDGAILYRDFIPENALPLFIERILAEFPDAIVGLELEDTLWLNKPRQSRTEPHVRHKIADLRTVAHLPTAKVLVFSDDLDNLAPVFEALPETVRLMPSGRYPFLQLMARGADKVTALRHLIGSWGCTLDNVVAFGDDINDIDLLREARLGVAVANSFPPALAVADHLAPSNDEDGVAQVLEALLAV
jgi:Cof subfamily protein (haloacid dehalogenase superfamily)